MESDVFNADVPRSYTSGQCSTTQPAFGALRPTPAITNYSRTKRGLEQNSNPSFLPRKHMKKSITTIQHDDNSSGISILVL